MFNNLWDSSRQNNNRHDNSRQGNSRQVSSWQENSRQDNSRQNHLKHLPKCQQQQKKLLTMFYKKLKNIKNNLSIF